LAALARRAGGRDRRPVLELAWRALVRCQFHDAIAGCAADDVARAVESRLTSVEALSGEVVRGSVHDLVHHDPDAARGRAASPSPTVPGLGLASAGLAAGATGARGTRPPGEGALVKGRSLVNHWIEVALEPTGALTLHDRRSGQRFTDLLRIEDGGDAGDTYTYCPPKGDRLVRSAGPIKVRRLAAGPLVAALETRFEIGRRVGIRLVAILYADGPMVRCILDIDNQAAWHRL